MSPPALRFPDVAPAAAQGLATPVSGTAGHLPADTTAPLMLPAGFGTLQSPPLGAQAQYAVPPAQQPVPPAANNTQAAGPTHRYCIDI